MKESIKKLAAIVLCIGIVLFVFAFGMFMGYGGKGLPEWLMPILIFGVICFVVGGGFTWYRKRLEKQAELEKLEAEAPAPDDNNANEG